jgi:hypothetical protein
MAFPLMASVDDQGVCAFDIFEQWLRPWAGICVDLSWASNGDFYLLLAILHFFD